MYVYTYICIYIHIGSLGLVEEGGVPLLPGPSSHNSDSVSGFPFWLWMGFNGLAQTIPLARVEIKHTQRYVAFVALRVVRGPNVGFAVRSV